MLICPSQAEFQCLRAVYLRQASVFLICFSVDNRASFDDVSNVYAREVTHSCPNIPFVLVGTKTDLRDDGTTECISSDEGEAKAKEIGAACYVECSSLKNENVNEVFEDAVRVSTGNNNSEVKNNDKDEGRCSLQ